MNNGMHYCECQKTLVWHCFVCVPKSIINEWGELAEFIFYVTKPFKIAFSHFDLAKIQRICKTLSPDATRTNTTTKEIEK